MSSVGWKWTLKVCSTQKWRRRKEVKGIRVRSIMQINWKRKFDMRWKFWILSAPCFCCLFKHKLTEMGDLRRRDVEWNRFKVCFTSWEKRLNVFMRIVSGRKAGECVRRERTWKVFFLKFFFRLYRNLSSVKLLRCWCERDILILSLSLSLWCGKKFFKRVESALNQ